VKPAFTHRRADAAPLSVDVSPGAEGLAGSWVRFWFTPVDPVGLHAVRVLAGLVFLAWLLPFAGRQDALFGLQGWFDRQAYAEAARLNDGSQLLGWSLVYLCGGNAALLAGLYWSAVAVFVLLSLGVAPRLTAILSWVAVASFTANPAIESDGDSLLAVLAFYLMVGYVLLGQRGHKLSWANRLLGPCDAWLFHRRDDAALSAGANFALRLLQAHFAIIIVMSGLHKLQFGDWWAGVALWFPLYPPLTTTLDQARAHVGDATFYLGVLSLSAYAMLAWQIGFPLFAWRPRWRPLLLGGAAVGWLGTAFIYDLPTFGPALCVGCLSYLTPGEWHRVFGWLARVPGFGIAAQQPLRKEGIASPVVSGHH
jgi:hypothetical protein